MKLSILSALTLSAAVVAAPVLAEDVKPVQPTVATQASPVVLGALTQAQLTALAFATLTVGVAALGSDSTPDTSSPSTISE